jgi:hypothetical protein
MSNLELKIADLEKRLAKLEAIVEFGKNGGLTIKSAGELRIQAPTSELRMQAIKVRIDAPGGVEAQPHLTTSVFKAVGIAGVTDITCLRINGLKLTKFPPFIFP